MKMIGDENARRITFSKRRSGLFKKASELSTLCGIEIAIIVFSLGGKAFSFGYPSVESVIDRFLNGNQEPQNERFSKHVSSSYRESRLQQLNKQFDKLNQELTVKKKQRKRLEKSLEDSGYKRFEDHIHDLGLSDLKQYIVRMQKLKGKVSQKVKELSGEASSKHSEEVDLSNIEKTEASASPVPHDWLTSKALDSAKFVIRSIS
ncbi:hypothetical protein RJ639_037101 [Escallonia herrerae]|uniref:MADS-box domain-containing protein n=1 Tax=Escallonia herrerae TaxID=1293975 RepID=A0AA89B9V6_9ASTE|nr:hypothetical protein RJ639_037101 [Escallonia herrerae]